MGRKPKYSFEQKIKACTSKNNTHIKNKIRGLR